MQNLFYLSFRVFLVVSALLVTLPAAIANNSIVLLVEQPTTDKLPLTIATSLSALTNFIKKYGDEAEVALVNYATTADVLQHFMPFSNDTSNTISSELKNAGVRGNSVNTASGMERAIALLNVEAKSENKKTLLVISDANISTGDKQLDTQFTEWLTEIISEDAIQSAIDVRWHPISKNANHKNIDAFLEKLNGQRIVLSPELELINQAATPQPPSKAAQQLELITDQITKESVNAQVKDEPTSIEETPTPTFTENVETPVIEEVAVAKEAVPVVQDSPAIDSIETKTEPQAPVSGIEEQTESLLSSGNVKFAVLLIIALTAIFLLKTLLSKQRRSAIGGTGLADKEYRDSSEVSVAVGSVAAVTKANAPIIPPRTLAPIPISVDENDPEPLPAPIKTSDVTESAGNESERIDIAIENNNDEDPMDGTQEIFPEFSSASLTAESVANQKPKEPEPEPTEIYKTDMAPKENQSVVENDKPPMEVTLDATVIAQATDFPSTTDDEKTVLAEEPEVPSKEIEKDPVDNSETASDDEGPTIDPYATVIADASQIQAYAKTFSKDLDTDEDEDDPEKTVLFRPDKDT